MTTTMTTATPTTTATATATATTTTTTTTPQTLAYGDRSEPPQTSMLRKAQESAELIETFIGDNAERIEACAHDLASCFESGGRLFTFGNGGSACHAAHLAVE